MVTSQAALIIEIARTKRLPTMLQDQGSVAEGALASYGVSFYTAGRLSAKHVQRVLLGADPGDLPVVRCPTCKGTKIVAQFSGFMVQTGRKS
jgi:putative ABC transport system substrate-binding protein